MKNKLIRPALIALIITLTGISCKLTNGEDETDAAPTVNTTGSTIGVSFAPHSGMTYANIFRQSCSVSNFSGTVTTLNIGQVVPADTGSLPGSFIFYDAYVDSTMYYRYYVRFYTGSYVFTDTSAATKNSSGTGTADLKVTGAAMSYDCNNYKQDYLLSLTTDTEVPDSNFTSLAVAISNGTKAKPYTLGTPASNIVASGAEIDLQKKLAAGFFDTALSITGLIGVYPALSTDKKYTCYYWTQPTTVTLKEKITDSKGTAHAAETVTEFTVPSPITTDNPFDYSSSRAAFAFEAETPVFYDCTPDLR